MKKRVTLIWIFRQIKKRIPALTVMTGAQIGYSLFLVLFALGTRSIIDGAVSGDTAVFHAACIKQIFIILGGLGCQLLMRYWRERLRAELERDWKKSLLHGLLHGEYAQVTQYHSAELLNRMNNDVSKVNEGVLNVVPSAASLVTRLAAAITALGLLDMNFTLSLAAFGGVMLIATSFMRRHLKELNKLVSAHDGRVSGFLQEMMEKLLIVQAMDVTQEAEKRADVLLDDRFAVQRKRKNISLLMHMGVSCVYYGLGFFALVWGAGRLLTGDLSFGALTMVIQLVNQLQAPFVNLSGVLPQYVAMLSSAERLMEIETLQGTSGPSQDAEKLYRTMRAICAKNLHFSYGQEAVLDGVDFSLPKGAFAVVTGPSGIGKSTILKLLLGIFRPDSGALLICGEKENIAVSRSTRRLFAYVPQGNLVLSGTLRENLTIVKPEATPEEIANALYVSTMDEVVSELPLGLETLLGENGMGLSEGQVQRLAIARAILSNAPILLLDECTSALDEATEEKVLLRIKALANKTCLAVTHRPAAIKMCDWRLEMENGKIRATDVDGI